jgi:glycosyltransferase involved in cell wall biosynthesis
LRQSMRVLQIVPSLSLVYGGPSQMALGFSEALADRGIDVTILTTNANGDVGQPPLDVPLDRPILQNGYQVRYFACSPFRRYKFSSDLLIWLWQHASEYDLAHIHALFSPVSTGAAWVARAQQLPYILRPLGTLDPADLQKKKQLKQIYAILLEKANLSGAAAVHFTSEEEAKISHRFGVKTRDLVLPLGVSPIDAPDPADANPLSPDRPTILFLSRIEPKKGLDLLLPALDRLLSEGLTFRFVLAGSNPQDPGYEAHIRQQIETSSLAQCTTIAGFVTGEAKAKLLQEADLFVLPSYYENFGIAVAEAMVAGLPVVISDRVQIWQDVQQSEAGWVSPCDADALAASLKAALQQPEERQRRGKNARTHALEHYSWEAIARSAIDFYKDILALK